MIFGGATRHILANASLPVLMAHWSLRIGVTGGHAFVRMKALALTPAFIRSHHTCEKSSRRIDGGARQESDARQCAVIYLTTEWTPEVHREQPLADRNLAALHDGSDRDGELVVTGRAIVEAGTDRLALRLGDPPREIWKFCHKSGGDPGGWESYLATWASGEGQ
jgi:hypothetical protein